MSANSAESATRIAVESTVDCEEFPKLPLTVTDSEARVLRFESGDGLSDERDSLAEMYDGFDSAGRSQGVPPLNDRRRQQWLDRIADGIEVVVWHEDRAVGHGILLSDGCDHELALFVRPEYRQPEIRSTLVRTLLRHGRAAGVSRVWLSVEQRNRSAVHRYHEVGFTTTETGHMAVEMRRSLG